MAKYQNPIIFADYSDPDVIRVGDTYYLTASSFNYTPGLPILTSKDLVNWSLVNYALKNIKEDRFRIPRHSEGVWAPSIRFHEDMFYIYYGMPDEGYFVVKTKDPLGEWDEPICILEGKGLIDPCPFWDEDGKAYVIHGYAKSRIGFKSILGIFEMSSDGLGAISEDHFIFNGNDPKHPAFTIEGPKVYKRDGYYYIWAPAGGVKDGYQVVLRSRDIHGPYEIKEVMHTGNTVINGPHQGGLVDTVNGDEWFIHFQDRGLYGRICHLQPVCWKNGWPIVGVNPDENDCGEPVFEYEKPKVYGEQMFGYEKNFASDINLTSHKLESSDDFENGRFGLQWQWLGNHDESFFSTADDNKDTNANSSGASNGNRKGLRMFALNPSGDENPIIWRSANVLTQKIIYPVFETEIRMDASGLTTGNRAGICMMGGQYITAYVEKASDGTYRLKVAESRGSDLDKKEDVVSELDGIKNVRDIKWKMVFSLDEDNDNNLEKISSSKDLYFQNVHSPLGGRNPSLKIFISFDGDEEKNKEWHDLKVNYTPSDHTWVGAKLGIYAISKQKDTDDHGYADFHYVKTTEL
ncbi:MAG: family 43 glycosylhydrolase [Butyrivibrio sp.]|nr:family 43 glycosylhydrolase [Butyrivibrio sp.]